MRFKHLFKRCTALALVLAVLTSFAVPAGAAESDGVSFEQVANDRVSASLLQPLEQADMPVSAVTLEEDEIVRVSILLEETPTIDKGYAVMGIAENEAAMEYRQQLADIQAQVTADIESRIGGKLDVQWNLTLATNIISANVEYGQIALIEAVDGVKEVMIEQQYAPNSTVEGGETASPNMIISTGMTGATTAWEVGYTGAGRRVAIIDTGIDIDHQSFGEAAYLHSLAENAEGKEMEYADYEASLDLLDAEEIAGKLALAQLNVYSKDSTVSGESLYRNKKVPFAFNYIDATDDYITHDQDGQSDHGSHVAGIAAANRYIQQGETMVNAAETVKVVGAAPDAQLIVLKVFGMMGGAYDSDYMAAIEDAIMLGADSINLSLGTAHNGYSNAGSLYERVMENLEKSGAVVAMAAGNESSWTYYAQNADYLGGIGRNYAEDVMYDRVGSPSSYTNALSVASVDNDGQINNAYLSFGEGEAGFNVSYSETLYNSMKAMTTLDTAEEGGTEYEFVMIEGLGQSGDLDFINVTGKIVFIPRGEIAFYEKATYAVSQGAIATVIYNNVDGTIGMDLTDYAHDEPAVAITKADGAKIKAIATEQSDSVDGKVYYTGTMRVHGTTEIFENENDYYTMSYFSSWGTTGDLALKPEITAPGGNIYSVKGDTAATDTYKVNSGTSMASPQVAGIAAVAQQYIEENGLTGIFGHSARQIAQSLLMSTAIPIKDGSGNYYSLLQQGSGLANSSAIVGSDTYIMMNEDATPSYADGKVKAELGDDPEKEGVYEFSFTIYNTNATADRSFKLSADVFTQAILNAQSAPGSEYTADYLLDSTAALDSFTFFLDEDGIRISDNTVTVPPKGSTVVKVRIQVSDAGKAWLDEHCPKGTYIQAYINAESSGNAEGVKTSTHSIPMLAFYGNWTDPYMFDSVSYRAGELVSPYSTAATTDKSRLPYREVYMWDSMGFDQYQYGTNYIALDTEYSESSYAYGGNPLVKDEIYDPARNAINGSVYLDQWSYVPMRDASYLGYEIKNLDTGEVYFSLQQKAEERGIYYSKSSAAWQGGQYSWRINKQLPDIPEGQTVEFSLTRLPEYYDEGKLGENSVPGSGATMSITAIVDSTSPLVSDIKYDSADGDFDITARDENYVAAVVLYNGAGDQIIAHTGSAAEVDKGEEAVYSLDTEGLAGGEYLLQVFDYAMNTATYYMEIEGDEVEYSGSMLAFNLEDNNWVQVDKSSNKIPAITDETRIYTAAAAVGEKIYAIAYGTELYCLNVADPESSAAVGDTGLTLVDLCYNAADGCLYGVSDQNKLVRVNTESGKGTTLGTLPLETNTIACDESGVFYSNLYGSGKIYSYTLDALNKGDASYDFNGDGAVNDADAQSLLDHVTGAAESIQNLDNADLDADNDVDTYDVYLLLDKLPSRINLVADTGIASKYIQAMEVDPNNGTLYWASYSTELIGTTEVGFSYIFEIDTHTGAYTRYADLWDQLSCFVVLDKHAGSMYAPVDGVINLSEAEAALADAGRAGAIASTAETAAVASLSGVDNSLKNTAADEAETVEIKLTAGETAANGLYTVSFAPALMELVSVESGAELTSCAESSGSVTFGYAGKSAFRAGDTVATLTFKTYSCEAEANITCKQENNLHPETSAKTDSGAHAWGEWNETSAATCVTDGERSRECTKCEAVDTEAIPADETLHGWSDWTVTTAAERNTPGVEQRGCSHCGTIEARWVLSDKMSSTEQTTNFGRVDIYENYVDYAKVTDAGIVSVKNLDNNDLSMRYLVELTADTAPDAVFDVYMQPTATNGSGHGYAIKREIVGSVGWDEDDTDYVVALENGIGKVTAYSYMNSSEYVMIEIYFMVSENGSGSGEVTYIDLPAMSNTDPYDNDSGCITQVGVWNASVNSSYWTLSEDETAIDGYIWLTTDTPADAAVLLEPVADGRRASITSGDIDAAAEGVTATLVNGKATVVMELTTSGGVVRTYTIHLRNHQNVAPTLCGGASGSARAKIGQPYTVDLSTIFTDINGDALSYTVSVNGAAAVAADEQYIITPDTEGELVLVFAANDGFMDSAATYTLTLNVSDTNYTPGDVNDDGSINNKDVTFLKRHLANWTGVVINLDAADTNGDGSVNNKDVTILKRYLANWTGVTLG